ncbi:MAG: hypothetical protein BIFFINMI_04256 [Phycisphaerae bacterium]|nr:hypothetical protein [Phycisphaerae bacterium]
MTDAREDMAEQVLEPEGELSPWWRYGILLILLGGFAVLFWIAADSYRIAPPIPARVVDPAGQTVFTGDDVRAGQEVFLKHGLMETGTIWGHGGLLGPDYTASYLHQLALDCRDTLARERFRHSPEQLTAAERADLQAGVARLLADNRFDPATDVLRFTQAETGSFNHQVEQWKVFFGRPDSVPGLSAKVVSDPEEIRQLTAFLAWTAWASAVHAPGQSHSYTINFPYDPAVGNGPTSGILLWSALSLIALLAGIAAVLFAFGRFSYLGWKGRQRHVHPQLLPGATTASQRATLKFFAVVSVLLLIQVLVGGAMAHFKAEPGNFYGFDLAQFFPVTILRTWHLQLAILWIATAFVAGGLFMASAFGQAEPRGQKTAINILFGALVLVIAGSLLGEVLGTRQWLGQLWFWFGNQGWEYLEIGRAWQILLVIGLVGWTILLVRGVGPARRDAKLGKLPKLFLLAAATIPLFYLPALFFGSSTNFTIVDTWRFWIIHLWVEGFFELFATVMVAVTFFKLGLVTLQTATRVIYIDAILFLGSGIIGTGHHWYWTGQSSISMALSAVFSAMEPVPLVLLTLDAADFVRLTSAKCDVCGRPVNLPHKWTFYFLIAVGVWNFIGAGIFGFLINLPIVSYYEAGTNLTVNHGHAALMGVFGMLAIAMLVFALRQVSTDDDWRKTEKYIRVSFWGLNIGLGLMVLLNLFPTGVLQFLDVVNNGYWHARGREFASQPLMRWLEWARLPADAIFIVFGAFPLFIATMQVWLRRFRRPGISS